MYCLAAIPCERGPYPSHLTTVTSLDNCGFAVYADDLSSHSYRLISKIRESSGIDPGCNRANDKRLATSVQK